MKVSEIKKHLDVAEFFEQVEALTEHADISWIDAITHCCEQRGIEPEIAATLVRSSPKIKDKVFQCSVANRLITE